ncbi:MAG: DUF992 domain-containing protein [Dehalococcoidia bacterium]|nr:DUF992 domain-containing protein [Dehalococcoidia bacterium]
MIRGFSLAATACVVAAALACGAEAQSRIAAGVLECRLAQGTSFVVGSVRDFDCIYRPVEGPPQPYRAIARRVGLDLGFSTETSMIWTVFAPTNVVGAGALAGSYVGVSAGAAIGIGIGANALVGGLNNSFALQPVSIEGQTGINVAAGIESLELYFNR